MKHLLLFFVVGINILSAVLVQETFSNANFEFSMQRPNKWFEADKNQLNQNLDKFDLDSDQLSAFIKTQKGSAMIGAFYKHNPKTTAGIIPTIQINIRNNPDKNFEEFKKSVTRGANGFKSVFSDFVFTVSPTETSVSGIKGMYFIGKFTMNDQRGNKMKVRSRTYAIPYKNYFFQLNFTDSEEKEDCSKEFDDLIKTITIGKQQ